MAAGPSSVRDRWAKKDRVNIACHIPQFYNNCIFQDVWRELCRVECLRESTSHYHQMKLQHISYLARLLLDCLLTHRFRSALWIMVGLCGSLTRRIPELLWKAGSEVMLNIPESHSRLVQFNQSMFIICSRVRPQLLLNFSLYLVTHSRELTEGHELLNARSGQRLFNNDPLIKAYLGLFEYVLWKKNKLKLQAQENHEGDGWEESFGQSTNAIERQMKFHGNRALLFFDQLVEQSGVWDIFITKQTELLQHYDRNDEARKILERYKEKNPENPNAYRYLYKFLKSEGTEKGKLCQVLESLLHLDPTNELTQEYSTLKLQSGASVDDILCVLFNKLDHSACRDSQGDWEALAHHLKELSMDYVKLKLQQYWKERSDWWLQYHFRTDLVPLRNNVSSRAWSVVLHKAEVADILLGRDNAFSDAVKEQEISTQIKKHVDHYRERSSEAIESSARALPRKRAASRTLIDKSEFRHKRKKERKSRNK